MTRWFSTMRGRLATVVVVALVLGLTVTGVTAWTVLSRSLVAEVDTRLEQVVEPLAQVASRNLLGGLPFSRVETESLPSDYFVLFVSADAAVTRQWSSTASGEPRSAPSIKAMTLVDVLRRRGEPFTVPALDGGSRWRVVSLPLASGTGSVAVALPMDTLDAASAQLKSVLIGVGALTALLGGLIGAFAVHRSLRPLREIEVTAAAIASGELGSRVPVAAPHTEIGHLTTSLNEMLSQLEAAFAEREASQERMRRFVSDASHELRTPLAAVRGYAELFRMGAVTSPEEVAATMRRVEESATRMGLLVEDLLALARLDEGAASLTHDDVDLLPLVRDAAQDLGALDPSREVRVLGLDGGPPGPLVARGQPRGLRQVVTNLVGNVAAHTPAGSPCEIALGLVAADDDVSGSGTQVAVVEVRDRGPGIAPEDAERVFERFFRADSSRGRGAGGGAGLGLAIVAAIVETHGGVVTARPREGGGMVFRVQLPAAPAAEPSPEPAAESAGEPTAESSAAPASRAGDFAPPA